MNLYLYIPPCSAHPPTMIRGLIFGRLRAYYNHNTDVADYHKMAILLAQRLVDRGWNFDKIRPVFKDAHDRITGKTTKPKPKSNCNMKPIFIHAKHQPRAIQRDQFRNIFDTTLGKHISNPLIIAVSRPKNLRERLCSSKLKPVDGLNPSDFV